MTPRPLALRGGLLIRPDRDQPVPGTVVVEGDRIAAVGGPGLEIGPGADRLDVGGRLVAPGVIDLHGDAFERCLMPRPGIEIDVDLALAENDAHLIGAGITTAYLSATDSWEPGLRSRPTLLRLLDGLRRRRGGPDVRLHVRHERCNTEAIGDLVSLLAEGRIDLLSYNDHTSDDADRVSMTQIQRSGLDHRALAALQAERARSRPLGRAHEQDLAAAARRIGCPTASHDPSQIEDLERDLVLGVAIAEFPTSIELAERYRRAGVPVLFGAPNLVRGGSHLSNLSVADALRAGVGDILCSDYHYPSLLQAPFVAAGAGILPIGRAWPLVSSNPAAAAGLDDRGRLEPGRRADLVVVEPPDRGAGGPARLELVLVAGRRATLAP